MLLLLRAVLLLGLLLMQAGEVGMVPQLPAGLLLLLLLWVQIEVEAMVAQL
jgi:hypothetical protein